MSIYGEIVFEDEDLNESELEIINRVDELELVVADTYFTSRFYLTPVHAVLLEQALYKWRVQYEFENARYPGDNKED